MRPPSSRDLRVLAITPSTRGFGFAMLEGADLLVDWGVKPVRHEKNLRCLAKIKELARYYQPEVIVLEDHVARDSRRHARIHKLIGSTVRLASQSGIRVRRFSRSNLRLAFRCDGAQTKHEIAV